MSKLRKWLEDWADVWGYIKCDFTHREWHCVVKRTSACEIWLCTKCKGKDHRFVRLRKDAFD